MDCAIYSVLQFIDGRFECPQEYSGRRWRRANVDIFERHAEWFNDGQFQGGSYIYLRFEPFSYHDVQLPSNIAIMVDTTREYLRDQGSNPKGPAVRALSGRSISLSARLYVQCPEFHGRLQGGPHRGGIEPSNRLTTSLSECQRPAEQLSPREVSLPFHRLLHSRLYLHHRSHSLHIGLRSNILVLIFTWYK